MRGKDIDLLDRGYFMGNIIKIIDGLSENQRGCCFAIEGGWGIGKTFVIENIEQQLNLVINEETKQQQYFVFHYNCWQYDYYDEPLVAIISSMLASINKDSVIISEEIDSIVDAGWKVARKKLIEIAQICIENKIGVNLFTLMEDISAIKNNEKRLEFSFDKMFSFSQTVDEVRKKLKEIAKERTIVLFVDEIDRCIPQYAIKILERLHHIFCGLENIVVVMAIDRAQLEHSVEEMFGLKENSIDVEKYLKKFIDFSVRLNNGRVNESFMEKYKFYSKRFTVSTDEDLSKLKQLVPFLFKEIDIRRQEKIIKKASVVHSIICKEKVDLSVLAFELIFEVLKHIGFDDLSCVANIGRMNPLKDQEMLGYLKLIEKETYHNYKCFWENGREVKKKCIVYNFFGRVFWYYACIFNEENNPYVGNGGDDEVHRCVDIAYKYCEFCDIIV